MGGITSSFNLSVGSGLSGAGTVASPLTNAGVTSVATGNGLSGGTITSTGTLVVAAPSAGSVGSYINGTRFMNPSTSLTTTFGTDYAAGSSVGQVRLTTTGGGNGPVTVDVLGKTGQISGTWRWMGATTTVNINGCCGNGGTAALMVRVS